MTEEQEVCSERHRMQRQIDSLRSRNKAKDRQISDLSERARKLGKVAHAAINRAEASESQFAELRGKFEAMAMVYPTAGRKEVLA